MIADTPKTKRDLLDILRNKNFTKFEIRSDIFVRDIKRQKFATTDSKKVSVILIEE